MGAFVLGMDEARGTHFVAVEADLPLSPVASSAVRDARQGFGGRGSAAQGEVLEIAPRLVEDILVGTGAGEMDEDSADGDF